MYWHTKMYEQWICKEKYEIHRFWVPRSLDKKIKWLRKYFRVMDRDSIPRQFKRRKDSSEFCETAIMILGRLDQLFDIDVPIVAGSAYLGKQPWAIFGDAPQHEAKITFRDFEDIMHHYHNAIVTGPADAEYFHFRVAPALVEKLSDKHRQTSHFLVSVGLCLLYDILTNCGPDCAELYDLFTNDLRVGPDSVNLEEWQDLRCKVMGRHGRIKEKPHKHKIGQIYKPHYPLISRTNIDLINESDDIASGEKVQMARRPNYQRYYPVVCADDCKDTNTECLETDYTYQKRLAEISKRHPQLNLGAYCH